jgi:GH24 family phage-related lysozyme (muramidase)
MSESLSSPLKIDFKFISKLEGSSCTGYVPDPKNSQSGVTIASGFDIGQRSESELKQAFTGDLCLKLLPYSNKNKQDACDTLARQPLIISQEEADNINFYSHKNAQKKLIQEWQAANSYTDFELLCSECQTVVASVAFQYGSLAIKTPNFWHQVTSGDWQAAYQNLRNFGDKYPSRRNTEADLLATKLS